MTTDAAPVEGEETKPKATTRKTTRKTARAKPKAKADDGLVECTVTKAGDGKVFDGKGGYFKRRDTFKAPRATAESLEARHYVETD